MPTALAHVAVPLALGLGLGRPVISGRLLAAGTVASMLPDADVVAFRIGIPYAAEFGHRGFSHSLAFAALIALLAALCSRLLRSRFRTVFLFLFVAVASHGFLDAFTNGGLGVAFFWPFSCDRYFAPVRRIEVAPIAPSRLFSPRGAAVLLSELLWVGTPCAAGAMALAWMRRRSSRFMTSRPFRSRPRKTMPALWDSGGQDPSNQRFPTE